MSHVVPQSRHRQRTRPLFKHRLASNIAAAPIFEAASPAILRVLDICQMLIDTAYETQRLRLLSEATGMKVALIENLIALS